PAPVAPPLPAARPAPVPDVLALSASDLPTVRSHSAPEVAAPSSSPAEPRRSGRLIPYVIAGMAVALLVVVVFAVLFSPKPRPARPARALVAPPPAELATAAPAKPAPPVFIPVAAPPPKEPVAKAEAAKPPPAPPPAPPAARGSSYWLTIEGAAPEHHAA